MCNRSFVICVSTDKPMGNSHELTSLTPNVPGVPSYLTHSHLHALETAMDLWKMVYLVEKQLLSAFSIQHSASSDALWKLWLPVWWKTSTLNTIWQVWVWHFRDRQAISHCFWVKMAPSPSFIPKACETCKQNTVQWHTQMSGLRSDSDLVDVTTSQRSRMLKR